MLLRAVSAIWALFVYSYCFLPPDGSTYYCLAGVDILDTWRLNYKKSKVSQQSVTVLKEQMRQRSAHGNSSFVHVFCKKEHVLQYAFLLYWIQLQKNTAIIL